MTHHDPAAARHRCSIVPPHLLERLAQAPDAEVAARAREALLDVDRVTLHRHAHALPGERTTPQPRMGRSTLGGGPIRVISDAQNETILPGIPVRAEGEPETGDVAATEAYDGLGHTWQLYAEAFERNSLDGRGMPLRASVHYGRDYDNAFWDGTQMVFGDGDARVFGRFTASLDVIGHELAHGVTEHTAGLMYQGQAGALNESMSDVFGSLVKQRALGQDAGSADWLVGAELLIGEAAGMALRSLKAPGTAYDTPMLGKDPQPGHMNDYVDTDEDHGGVHINSGIPNRAFYLCATALGGNAWEAPGQIWYAVLTGPGISADCDFVTFAGLTVDEAITRHGADSPEANAVREAWAQVGVLGTAQPDEIPVDAEPVPLSDPPDWTDGSDPAPDPAPPPDESGTGYHEPSPDDFEHEGVEVPADAVVDVSRSGGIAGLTVHRSVVLQQLPPTEEQEWRSVLRRQTLQSIDAQAQSYAGRTIPDSFCYQVSCALPPVEVAIAEQHLPAELRALFERTLRGD